MKSITIRLGDSTQQQKDIEQIKQSAHNMAGAALDVAKHGSMGYDQYLASKQQFDSLLETISKNYKRCEIA